MSSAPPLDLMEWNREGSPGRAALGGTGFDMTGEERQRDIGARGGDHQTPEARR